MNLLTKINIRFLIAVLILFTTAGVIMFFVLKIVASDNIDEILENRIEKIKQTISQNPNCEFANHLLDPSIKVENIDSIASAKIFSDTILFDSIEKENVEYRKLTSIFKNNEKYYKIQLTLARFETEDMVEFIFYSMLSLFAFIVFILLIFNRWLFRSLWSPFFNTLQKIKKFKVGGKDEIVFVSTNIYEFDQLNSVLNEMMVKTQTDFNNLKEFTENASHEIQTPLSIIKSKLESLLQDKLLSAEQIDKINISYATVSRLSKLNEALLLLSKIENNQFVHILEVNLCDIIKEKIEYLEEMLAMKNISILVNVETPFVILIHYYLAETLVNNLISNAIKHNIENGEIKILSENNRIIFSNTGNALTINPDKIFQRFVKDSSITDSSGLGLSIVAEICRNNKMHINYIFQNGLHDFIIKKT